MFAIEYARLSKPHSFYQKVSNAISIIAENEIELLEAYHALDKSQSERLAKYERQINLDKEAFKTQTCAYCGGRLIFIQGYNFWGCANYKNAGKHSSFNSYEPNFGDYYVQVSPDWVTEIIRSIGLDKKLKAKELYEFYMERGLEDLRLKYHSVSTETRIYGYINTKKRSDEQERKSLEFLKNNFTKVIYQQNITYKLKGLKETFCIPDFICSNSKEIIVMDAKLNWLKEEQLDLYVALLKHVCKNEERKIYGSWILDHPPLEEINTKHSILII